MKKLILAACIAISITGCYNDKYDKLYPAPQATIDLCDTATNPSTYSDNVKGIIMSSCAISGCHDENTAGGGYDLSKYDQVKVVADNGLLLSDINSGNMPKDQPKLSDCKIKQITYWVNHGAQNN